MRVGRWTAYVRQQRAFGVIGAACEAELSLKFGGVLLCRFEKACHAAAKLHMARQLEGIEEEDEVELDDVAALLPASTAYQVCQAPWMHEAVRMHTLCAVTWCCHSCLAQLYLLHSRLQLRL